MVVEIIIIGAIGSVTAVVIAGKLERRYHKKRLYVSPFTSREAI